MSGCSHGASPRPPVGAAPGTTDIVPGPPVGAAPGTTDIVPGPPVGAAPGTTDIVPGPPVGAAPGTTDIVPGPPVGAAPGTTDIVPGPPVGAAPGTTDTGWLPGNPLCRGPAAAVAQITVALIETAAKDLQTTQDRTQLSKTDIVNRAVSLYEFIDAELSEGAELIVRRGGHDNLLQLL